MDLSDNARITIVNKLDPDGRLRDLIDVALQRYHQRRSVADGTPPPSDERPDPDGSSQAGT